MNVVGPLIVNFKNRTTSCNAAVLPGESEILLGSISMEDLDVVLVPKLQTIDVNPNSPYIAKKKIKSMILENQLVGRFTELCDPCYLA